MLVYQRVLRNHERHTQVPCLDASKVASVELITIFYPVHIIMEYPQSLRAWLI